MLGKYWMTGNLPWLTEPFHLQSVSTFIQNVICVQLLLTSLKKFESELHKIGVRMGGRIAGNQSTAAQEHCFLAGPYRSMRADRMFTCTTYHYITYPVLCVIHNVTKPRLKCYPYTLAPPKLFAYAPASTM